MSSRKYLEERRQKRKRQNRLLTILMAGGVILVVGAVILAIITSSNVNLRAWQIEKPEFTDLEQFDLSGLGDPEAPVLIEEYSDFGCGHCAEFALEKKKLIEDEYIKTGKVALVFRTVGFVEEAPVLQQAIEAVYCAGEQEAFWDYHDLLFANQAKLFTNRTADISKTLDTFANMLELDENDFDACLADGKYQQLVNENRVAASELGVTGTPTFFINGQKLVGNQPFESFQQAIENALEASN
jgi:protein-disulfide isomerase